MAEPEVQDQGAGGVARGEADMFEQQAIELQQRLVTVLASGQGHFLKHERMAANRALAENHQVARKNIRALHGDEDWRALPATAQVVVRAHDDGLAAMDVHGMADAFAATLGQVVLENRRQHRGLFSQVYRIGGEHPCAVHQPGIAADPRQGFLDSLEGAERHIELFTDLGVLASDQAGELGRTGTDSRQGNRTAHRQAIHQHHPAFAKHFLAADQEFQGDEHILAGVRAVHEGSAQR